MRKKNIRKRQPKQAGPAAGSKSVSKKKAKPAVKKRKHAAAPAAVLDSDRLKSLYATMLRCRQLSRQMPRPSSGESIPVREAVLVGAASHALPEDKVIAGSASLQWLIAQLFPAGDLHAKHSLDHSALQHGMKVAGEFKGQKKAVIVFCQADMAADEIENALGRAAKEKLPLVCVAESGMSVIDQEQARQHDSNAARQDMSSFFPRLALDGTDVVAMFRVAQEAVRRARGGNGPSLVQCVMPESAREKEKNDPLMFMERYLRRRKLWSDKLRKDESAVKKP
jgi:TPP-dependent pyruvate/acetoin dehydrogenase alpha subunit